MLIDKFLHYGPHSWVVNMSQTMQRSAPRTVPVQLEYFNQRLEHRVDQPSFFLAKKLIILSRQFLVICLVEPETPADKIPPHEKTPFGSPDFAIFHEIREHSVHRADAINALLQRDAFVLQHSLKLERPWAEHFIDSIVEGLKRDVPRKLSKFLEESS